MIQTILVSTNLHSRPSIWSDYNHVSSVFLISLLGMNNFSNIVLSVFWEYFGTSSVLLKYCKSMKMLIGIKEICLSLDICSRNYSCSVVCFVLWVFFFQIHKIKIWSGQRKVTCVNDPCPCTLLSSEDSFNHIYPHLQ